jgi:pyridoxine/pyridoxamine 5'-phosphate oxidase
MPPVGELDGRYSSPGAAPTPWAVVDESLQHAEIFWISTVRPGGQPHTTPVIAIWLDDAIHIATGASERKALNLAENPACTITTGCNALNEGLDIVIEGQASRIQDHSTLQRLADLYKSNTNGISPSTRARSRTEITRHSSSASRRTPSSPSTKASHSPRRGGNS